MSFDAFKQQVLQCSQNNSISQEMLYSFQYQLQQFKENASIPSREIQIIHSVLDKVQGSLNKYRKRNAFKFSKSCVSTSVVPSECKVSLPDTNCEPVTIKADNVNEYSYKSNVLILENLVSQRIDQTSHNESQDILIQNNKKCVIVLQNKCSALTLKNVSESTVLIENIGSSAFIENCHSCIMLIALTHQVRIHSSTNVLFFLNSKNTPVLEDCDKLLFSAPIPCLQIPTFPEIVPLKLLQIVDFNWQHPKKASPHYSLLDKDQVNTFLKECYFNKNTLNSTDPIQTCIDLLQYLFDHYINITNNT